MDWTPEFSRRARGLAVYATLRALGRDGVAELVDRLCACAERFADGLAGAAGFEVLGQQLNQVVVACADDELTDATLAAAQAEGTCYPSGTELARPPLDPLVGLQLADHGGGRRPVGRRPRRRP